MSNCDLYDFSHRDVRDSHAEGNKGSGERDYFDHLRAQRLSVGERVIVFLVLGLVAAFAVGGRPAGSNVDVHEITSSISSRPAWHDRGTCDDYSPYGDRGC